MSPPWWEALQDCKQRQAAPFASDVFSLQCIPDHDDDDDDDSDDDDDDDDDDDETCARLRTEMVGDASPGIAVARRHLLKFINARFLLVEIHFFH